MIMELNNMFSNYPPMRDISYNPPGNIAEGSYRKILLNNEITITSEKIKFFRDTQMSGKTSGELYLAYFSLEDEFNWIEEISRTDWQISSNQGVFLKANEMMESCIFEENKQNTSIGIIVTKDMLDKYLSEDFILSCCRNHSNNFYGKTFSLNETIKRVLLEISNCPFINDLKYMYLEGKVIELFSNMFNELIETRNSCDRCIISKSELECIKQVKKIIDADISRKLSIKELSRLGHINECKLKQGFKIAYGKTIHGYVVDSRMKFALHLLEKGFQVNQVAHMVGYSDISSFSRAFKKQYGFSPINMRGR